MGIDSSEGPFRDRKLVWNKFYELKFFHEKLNDIDDPPLPSEEQIEENDAFRFRLSALLGAGYSLQSFFDQHTRIEPDLFPEDSLQLHLHDFLMEQRHITVHMEKPSKQQAEVIQGLTRGVVQVDGDFRFRTEGMNKELVEYFETEGSGSGSFVPVAEVLEAYMTFIEERLEGWRSPPERIGVTAKIETWNE